MLIEEILIIRHDGVLFGISTASIGQILRVPEITPLALSPHEVRGLCAVGGGIVTVLDFNLLLGLNPCGGVDQASRVITLNEPLNALALLVDEVTVSLMIDQKRIEYLDVQDEAIVAIAHHEDALIQIVSLEYVIGAIRSVKVPSQAVSEKTNHTASASVQTDDKSRYLVFKMGSEEYALPIDELREILNADVSITEMAGANDEIIGMMSLRDELVVVADLRRFFGVKPHRSDKNRIMIVQMQKKTLGLMIDEIVDIHEFSKTDLDSLGGGNDDNRIAGVIRNEKKLISLIANSTIESLLERNNDIVVSNEVSALNENAVDKVEVVIFKLGNEEYAFSIEEVAEIIDMAPVTPVANAADRVDGIINIRG
ncbi:MAG: hypothetical protein QG558_1390, partial [Campylobacterota bacterium]|nr:hypothetical protein [Campylobacterota bacterium]